MTWEVAYVLAVAAAAIALFITEWLRMDQVAIGVPVLLLLGGIIDIDIALSGLSNSATVTVAATLVLGRGLEKTGVVQAIGRWAARLAFGGPGPRLGVMCLLVAAISPFLSNTAVVVVFLPVFTALAAAAGQPPSRYLLPLSYAAILGGTITLIGTSTNLIVHNLARNRGYDELSMFSIAPLGLIYLVAGLAYLFTIGIRLLPRRAAGGHLEAKASSRAFTTELIVTSRSRLVGAGASELAERYGLRAAEPVGRWYHWPPWDSEPLRVGDVLRVSGDAEAIFRCAHAEKLDTPLTRSGTASEPADARTIELIVSPGSRFAGRSLRELRFGSSYEAAVIGLQRPRRPLAGRLSRERLAVGDLLLVHGSPDALSRLLDDKSFTAIGEVSSPTDPRPSSALALTILVAVVATSAVGLVSITYAALVGAVAMIFTRCIRIDEVYREMDWMIIALLAGLLPLGVALDQSGAAALLGALLADLVAGMPPALIIGCFYLVTSILTEVMSNQAAAVVLTPIALSTASTLQLNPYALLVAVMFGASASFMTPMGYQTNALVYGPGGYRFSDYLRVGAPLNALLTIVAAVAIPLLWP